MKQYIGLIGKNGAGKSEASSCLKTLGFRVVSLSDYVREAAKASGMFPNRENLIKMANHLKATYGQDVLAQKAFESVKAYDKVVFDSIRNESEIDYLVAQGVTCIGIDAPVEVRYERIHARGGDTDHIDFETFKAQDELESSGKSSGQHLNAALAKCDHIIQNTGTSEDLLAHLTQLVKKDD